MIRFGKYLVVAGAALSGLGCATTPAQHGALTGGALGAGLGAIIGSASGNPGIGAAIGAGAGAATGALVGDAVDHDRYRDNRHYHTTSGTYVYEPAPPPAPPPPTYSSPGHFSKSYRLEDGHYEVRLVRAPSGEYYEERVWVSHR